MGVTTRHQPVPDVEQVIGVHQSRRKHEQFLDCRINAIPDVVTAHLGLLASMSSDGFSLGGKGYVPVDRTTKECLKFL
jgi:hypothetical protein